MKQWQTLDRTLVQRHNSFLSIEKHVVKLPDGRIIDDWPWVITPDYVNILARSREGYFLFFRQVKYAIEGTSLAPVGGYIDPGENPWTAAKRELLEETGYRAPQWCAAGKFLVDANRGCGQAFFFAADNAVRQQDPDADDLEEQTLLSLSQTEVQAAIQDRSIRILPWIAAVALCLPLFDNPQTNWVQDA